MSKQALALSAALLATAACRASVPSPEPELRALIASQQAAWNRGDLQGFMRIAYWDSPELVFYSGGEVSRGFGPMLARYVARYQSGGAEAGELTFSGIEVRELGSDHALARGHWFLDFKAAEDVGGLFTLVFERRPEGWRIVHDHTSVPEKAPAKVQ